MASRMQETVEPTVDEVICVSTYRYDGEVLVELVARDPRGEPLAISYEFDATDDGSTLEPRESLDDEYASPITDALTADGYTVAHEQ